MDLYTALDWARICLCLICLSYASWSDVKWREVSDIVWIILAPLGLGLTLLRFHLSEQWFLLGLMVLSTLSTIVISFLLSFFNLFGSADALALISLSLAIPLYPEHTPIFRPTFPVHPFLPLSTLFNGVLVAASSVFYMVGRNIVWKLEARDDLFEGLKGEGRWKRFLAFISGYKVPLSDLERNPNIYSLERIVVEEGKTFRKLKFSLKIEDRDAVLEELKKSIEKGALPSEIWVTLALPMIFFLTIGFILSLLFGDLIFRVFGGLRVI